MRGCGNGNGGPQGGGVRKLVVIGHVGTSIVHVGARELDLRGRFGLTRRRPSGAGALIRPPVLSCWPRPWKGFAPRSAAISRRVDLDGVIEFPGPFRPSSGSASFDDGQPLVSAPNFGVRGHTVPDRYLSRALAYLDAD